MPPLLSVDIARDPQAPAQARRAVERCELAPELTGDVRLLVSELITNSVKYGGEGDVRLIVSSDGSTIDGIVSERDVVRHLHSDGTVINNTVRAIMTAVVQTAEQDTQVDELMKTMTERRICHVPVVEDVRWEGQGCSISQASASVLHDLVVGQDLDTVDRLAATFRDLMGSRGAGLDDEAAEEALGDGVAFTGVGKFSARVKCALLGWAALSDALILSGAREAS